MRAAIAAFTVLLVGTLLAPTPPAALPAGRLAAAVDLPNHAAIVAAAKLAADYYRPTFAHTTLTPTNGWSWSTYAEGVQQLYRAAGDARYLTDGLAWGTANGWKLTTAETNPDTVKAGQTYDILHALNPSASLAAIDARMAADLAGLPTAQYDWADALFMGLPNWALAARRTGNTAYLTKLDTLYAWTRDRGATSARCAGRTVPQPGLFDATQALWYRDCRFVGVPDTGGAPVFWGRGNGWVIAAMAEVVQLLPAADPRAAAYADMLRTMAARLVQLQGSDGLWRASLLNPALYPQPETSATALITYGLALGIRLGVLDAATYRPAVARAWQGLTTISLRPGGFVTGCQGPGAAPAAPYTATGPRTAPTSTSSGTVNLDSPPFCVGAFLLAGSATAALVPALSTGRPVTATAQQVGNEATRVVDGDVTTRWSAPGFPQSVTVDLGSVRTVGNSMVVPYLDRAYRFRIETSTDRATWQLVVDRTGNTTGGSAPDVFTPGPVTARYVRLTVTGVAGAVTTWVSIQEFAVYPPPSSSPSPVIAADAFGRTVTGGFGTADVGGAWAAAGSAAPFAVTGGAGRVRMATPGSGPAIFLTAVSAADVDLRVDAVADKPATGSGTWVALAGRRGGTDDYRAKIKWAPTGAVTLTLMRVIGGVEALLPGQSVVALTGAATVAVRIRFQLVGTNPSTLRAKAWPAGAVEPAGWQLTATDGTAQLQRAGGIGIWAYLSGAASTAPVTVSVDNLSAVPYPPG